jgi:hypothetical protein
VPELNKVKNKIAVEGPLWIPKEIADHTQPYRQTRDEDWAALQADWRDRARRELEQKKKADRRRERSAQLRGEEPADPDDCLPLTVYPIEPESLVNSGTCFIPLVHLSSCLSLNAHRMPSPCTREI